MQKAAYARSCMYVCVCVYNVVTQTRTDTHGYKRERTFQTTEPTTSSQPNINATVWCIVLARTRACSWLCVGRMHRVAHKRSSAEGRATVTRKYGCSELSLSFAFTFPFPPLSLSSPLPILPFHLLLFLSFLVSPSSSLVCLAAFQWPALSVFVYCARYRLIHEPRPSRLFAPTSVRIRGQKNNLFSRTIAATVHGKPHNSSIPTEVAQGHGDKFRIRFFPFQCRYTALQKKEQRAHNG